MKKNKPKDARYIPYLFFIFFGVIITVDIIFIYISNKTWRGVVTEGGYYKGLKYNETLEATKKQQDLGWQLDIKYDVLAVRFGNLKVSIKDKNNLILKDAKVFVKLTRPVQEGSDFELELKFNSKTNIYDSRINFPLKGQWNAEIQVFRDQDVYQQVKRIVI